MMIPDLSGFELLLEWEVAVTGNVSIKRTSADPWCPWCGQSLEVIWVHGHGQCRVCGTNVHPCCDGKVQECGVR